MSRAGYYAGLPLRALIWLYRHSFALLFGGRCRFLPTCSDYADEAIRLHGPVKGLGVAFRRICRCHPWGGHGFDPVPKEGVRIRDSGFRDEKAEH